MPGFDEIEYSRDACIAAIRDYYQFLTKLYLDESYIIEPPSHGWPSIISADLNSLTGWDKSDEVMQLLAHLPYVCRPQDDKYRAHAFPGCYFADWQNVFQWLSDGWSSGDESKLLSEGEDFCDHAPPQVIGLTYGGRSNQIFVLDTELGIVHWPGCPGKIRYEPIREQFLEDPYDYAAENEGEAEWRGDSATWAIPDFFEILKDQFRELKFVPTSSRTVLDIYTIRHPDSEGVLPMLQEIYRAHGWPDLERYRKKECLQAVQEALEERYPHLAESRDDEGNNTQYRDQAQ